MDGTVEPESPHANQMHTVRALVTRVRQSLNLMTQRAPGNAALSSGINTRLRPLALMHALDFLRGLQLWLPVSWRPAVFSAQKESAHDAAHYEYRRKRPPPKPRARRFDAPAWEQNNYQEPAASFAENTSAESLPDTSAVAFDDDAAHFTTNSLTFPAAQLETVAELLDVTAPHGEPQAAGAENFPRPPAFAPQEFFRGDLAAEYTRQLGLAALTPIVAPRPDGAPADAPAAPAREFASHLPIADLTFEPQVELFLSTLAHTGTAADANFDAPRADAESQRIVRVSRTSSQNRASAPSPSSAATLRTRGDTLSIRAGNRRAAETGHDALDETLFDTSIARDSTANTTQQSFAARMNLSALLIAPEVAALADEIADHHLPFVEREVLAQSALPRMFAELVLNSHAAPAVSESASDVIPPAPPIAHSAPSQFELRAAQPQPVSTRPASPVEPANETSEVDEANPVAVAELAEIHSAPPIRATDAWSLYAAANLAEASDLPPRSAVTAERTPGAAFDVTLPPFRLSDEIRARVTSFPHRDTALNDDTALAPVPTVSFRPWFAAPSPRRRDAAAPIDSRRMFSAPRSMMQAALSLDLGAVGGSLGARQQSPMLRQDMFAPFNRDGDEGALPPLAHSARAAQIFSPPPALQIDKADARPEDDAALFFDDSPNARAAHSAFAARASSSFAPRALFQTLAQPLGMLAVDQDLYGDRNDANVAFAANVTLAQDLSSALAFRAAMRPAQAESPAWDTRTNAANALPPPPAFRAPAIAPAPNMQLRQATTFSPAVPPEQAEPSRAAWHGSISDSVLPELGARRAQDFPPRAGDEYAAPRDAARNPVPDSAPAPQPAASAPVNVNALAQQVYALLKTELRAERERHQLYRR